VDYLPYVSILDFTIMTRRPKELPSLETLFAPFDRTIWFMVGIAVLSEFLLFVTIDRVSCSINMSNQKGFSSYLGKSHYKRKKYFVRRKTILMGGLVKSRAACRSISERRRTRAHITVVSSFLFSVYVVNKTVSCVLMNMILVISM
jgi:hypothetical protein